jgi:sulfite exporter TauE/SafE
MLAQFAGVLYGFLWGMRRGASTCMALCVPVIMPTLMEQRGWKKGVKVALYYNAPRIVALTLLGMGIGAGGYAVGASLEQLSVGSTIWAVGYVVVGCLMIAYGTYIFASASERLDDIREGKSETVDGVGTPGTAGSCESIPHPVLKRMGRAAPKSRTGLILWGCLVSLACVGETVIALEVIFVGVFTGTAGSPAAGAAIGGFAFFLFALGTAFPTILIAGLSSRLAGREKRRERLLQVERIAGALMIGFGILFVLGAIIFI